MNLLNSDVTLDPESNGEKFANSRDRLMKDAIKLALRGRRNVTPNPMVGALVISQDGKLLGSGFHPKAGASHAEVFAIEAASKTGEELSTATLYVTLEPCNHFGRTPPCLSLILKSGIKTVVVGTLDPNPLMSGKSIQSLRDHGVRVTVGVEEADCKKLIRGFSSVITQGRPFVTIKAATSLDGKIATAAGESKWITDESSRALAHEERSQHDAIMIGVGTVLADDPQLTARLDHEVFPVTKVILDSRLLTSPQAKLFSSKDRVLIYCDSSYSGERRHALEAVGAEVVPMEPSESTKPGFLDLEKVLRDLADKGIQELLVEGGARVLGAIVREELFDRIVYFLAPKILGSTSRDVFEGLDVATLDESIHIEALSARVIGKDVVIEGKRVHRTH